MESPVPPPLGTLPPPLPPLTEAAGGEAMPPILPGIEALSPRLVPPVLAPAPGRRGRISVTVYAALGLLLLAAGLGTVVPGELGEFFQGSWEVVLFAALCVLAYLGVERRWARVLAGVLLGVLLLLAVGLNTTFSWLAIAGEPITNPPRQSLPPGGAALLAWIAAATLLAALSALLAWLPGFRRLCTPLTGNAEWTSVRTLALAVVVSFTLVACVPLLALGEPPMLLFLESSDAAASLLADARGAAGMLRDQMYSLSWTLVAATLAVGHGIRRNGRETLSRLGLRRVSIKQVGVAVLLTAALLGMMHVADLGITQVWQHFGWRMTDGRALEALFDPFISPLGAVVIGICAGVGEEVAVRGILQPRLGILLPNLLFTALHAYQYNWDGLLAVFLIGLVLGLIRKRTSTTVSAMVHGGYDFVLVILAVLESGSGG